MPALQFEDFVILKKKLHRKKAMSFNIASDSMSPLIKINDKIEIVPVRTDELQLFDIIVFWQFDRLLCHFIVKTISPLNTASLKNKVDYPVKEELILGKVVNFKLNLFHKVKYALSKLMN